MTMRPRHICPRLKVLAWTMRPLVDASLEGCVPWTICALWTMCPLNYVSLTDVSRLGTAYSRRIITRAVLAETCFNPGALWATQGNASFAHLTRHLDLINRSLTRVFRLQVFSWLSVPQAPKYFFGAILNFFETARRYSRIIVYHRCYRHRW